MTYYRPHWTGLTAHAVRIAEGLAARGHGVTVLTSRHDPALPGEEVLDGVRVLRLETAGRFSRGMVVPSLPAVAWRLMGTHDVVQLHTPLPEAALLAVLARARSQPLVMTHHGDIVMPRGGLANRLLEKAAFCILLATARLAGAVTSYSHDYARCSPLLSSVPERVTAIRPPVDLPPPEAAAVAAWRRELGLEGKTLIGFAGRWVEEKGFDVLLRALPHVLTSVPDAHLVFAGERSVVYEDFFALCRPLAEAAGRRLVTLGLLHGAQRMANFHALCDLFVLPSRSDMLALVQVEAMLSGTPVVASDVPGARVLVKETGFGRVAPPGDPRALADAIVAALAARERLRPDPELVRRLFSPAEVLDAWERLLSRVLAG